MVSLFIQTIKSINGKFGFDPITNMPTFNLELGDIERLEYTLEQIKGRSNVKGFAMVSHETIYRWIWDDKRKKGTLYQSLRRKGKKYNKRGSTHAGRGYIPNRIDIERKNEIFNLILTN